MIKQLLLVGLGGGLGSILRYSVSIWIRKYCVSVFPLATFIVNITGCFIIGLLLGLSTKYQFINNDLKLLLIVGFCGGYTTFSTFSHENLKLLNAGNYLVPISYTVLSVVLGILAVWAGNSLAKIC